MKKIIFATCLGLFLLIVFTFHFLSTEAQTLETPIEQSRPGGEILLSSPDTEPSSQVQPESRRRPGHLLVRFKDNANPTEVARLKGNRAISENTAIQVTHLKVSPYDELAVFDELKRSPDVEFVEFDSVMTTTFVPNDTYYANAYPSSHDGNIAQWGPQAVSAPAAWDTGQGDASTVIAVVDTGVDASHPDLASKIIGQYTFTGKVKDGFGHGTHVAGIAAAVTNDSTGVAGMCPNCKILSVKVLDDNGSGYMSDVASGIVYAADHGAEVINLSVGGTGRSETLRTALDYAVNHNALPVCAMGNDSSSSALEPAVWNACLSVVATDSSGNKASFSTYGVRADVAAPGVGILSTLPTYSSYLSTHGYKANYDALSGTSMATPIVAGIAGLVRSRNPNLTPLQTKGIIMATAGDGRSWSPNLGFGLVKSDVAVGAAVHSDYAPPSVNLVSPSSGTTVAGAVTIKAAPTDDTVVHHIDLLRGGTRLIPPLVGVSTTSGTGGSAITTPAWTYSWPSTLVFNGAMSVTATAFDKFGNTSAINDVGLTVQNQLVTQSFNIRVCFPSTSACPNSSPWTPVPGAIATEAATRVQGTISYVGQPPRYPTFYVKLANGRSVFYCGTTGSSVECYPTTNLLPTSTSRSGSVITSNYIGGQLDGVESRRGGASEANINITLTYPQ